MRLFIQCDTHVHACMFPFVPVLMVTPMRESPVHIQNKRIIVPYFSAPLWWVHFFVETIKIICLEIICDVNVERSPLEPSNEACGISQAPNLTS